MTSTCLEFPMIESNSNYAGISKKDRRKITHSVIEKKRRERMNHCINQLCLLVPSCKEQENLQKLAILERTVEYMRSITSQPEVGKQDNVLFPMSPTPSTEHGSESVSSTIMSISNLLQ